MSSAQVDELLELRSAHHVDSHDEAMPFRDLGAIAAGDEAIDISHAGGEFSELCDAMRKRRRLP